MIQAQAIRMAVMSAGDGVKGAQSAPRENEGLFASMMSAVKAENTEPVTEDGAVDAVTETEGKKKEPRKSIRVGEMVMVLPDAALSALNAAHNETAIPEPVTDAETAGVFILEGTKEQAMPEAGQATEVKDPAEGEKARMPETGTQESATAANMAVESTDSRPLENGNGSAADTEKNSPRLTEQETVEETSAVETAEPAKAKTVEKPKAETQETADEPKIEQPANQAMNVAPEKASSNFQMREAAESTVVRAPAVSADNLFETMVERIEVLQDTETSRMSIQLKPEFLGKVSLEMTMTGGAMQVKISAEDADVKSMINGQITALVETLSSRGIKISAVDVVYTGVPDGGLADSKGGGQNAHSDSGTSKSGRADKIGGVSDFRADLPVMEQMPSDIEISSVEYTA